MQGAQALTPEMDIYAFAICCVEILTHGTLPWPLMDDDAVRRFVLSGYFVHSYNIHWSYFSLQLRTRDHRFRHRISQVVH